MYYHKTKPKGKHKSCKLCKNYKEKLCNQFNITISSVNNATYCEKI